MRTLLINPPYPISEFPTIPMGLAYVAAVLRKEGHEVRIADFLVSKYTKEKLERIINEYKPDIVGTTSVTLNYPGAAAILKDVKEINDNIMTVFGGPHVTFTPEETLTVEAPWVDLIVMGEGDYTLVDIIEGKPLREVKGIAFKEKGKVVITEQRPWIDNLDELPEPARDLFPISRYRALGAEGGIISSRGCPFGCTFCVGHRMVGKKGRFRDPKLVVDEIQHILAMGFKMINIVDDLLTINKKHVYAICDEIKERKLKFQWTAFSRVDTVNRELFTRMREAGCFFILYGVESGNQKILDNVRKKITLEETVAAVELARECDIRILASFIIGLPGETKETLADTVRFGKSLNTHYGFHLLSPFPGTEVREKAADYGMRILTNDWTKYDANEAIVEHPEVSAEDLLAVDRQYKADLDRYVKKLDALEKEGKLPEYDGIRIRGQRRGAIAGAMAQNDIIENLGTLRDNGDRVEDLVTVLADRIPHPRDEIQGAIDDLITDGLLRHEVVSGGVVWSWAR